jgi:hypothetical protein
VIILQQSGLRRFPFGIAGTGENYKNPEGKVGARFRAAEHAGKRAFGKLLEILKEIAPGITGRRL